MLELVVFTAMATLDVEFISTYIAPLLIYTFTLCAVTVPCVLITAKKFCKHEWFEKAMMAFGAATGNTSTDWPWYVRLTRILTHQQATPMEFIRLSHAGKIHSWDWPLCG